MDLFTCRFSPENPKKQTWEFHTRRLLEIHVPHFYSFCFTVSAEGGYPGGLGSGEKKLFPVSSSFAAWNLGAQEDFRCSTFPALFELSLGGELERKKVVVGGCVCAPSVSRGRAQVPGDVAVPPLLSQVHGQAAPSIAHIQPRPGSVQGHQRVQEALPGGVVHRSGEGGGVRAVGVRAVEQQQLRHAGAAHHHHLPERAEWSGRVGAGAGS